MSATATGEAQPSKLRWTLWAWFRTGLPVALLVSVVVIAERFDAALATFRSATTQGGHAYATRLMPGHFGPMWAAIGVYSTVLALLAARGVAAEIRNLTRSDSRDISRANAVVWSVAVLWSVWNLSGPVALRWPQIDPVRAGLHVASIALLIAALLAVGAIMGDIRETWRRASIVRVQVLVLGLLFVGVYVFPMTVGQAVDVFRAWADGSVIRPVVGVAGALLLGAAVRDSAASFVVRGDGAQEFGTVSSDSPRAPARWGWGRVAAAGAALVLAGVAIWWGEAIVLEVALVCAATGAFTRWTGPPPRPGGSGVSSQEGQEETSQDENCPERLKDLRSLSKWLRDEDGDHAWTHRIVGALLPGVLVIVGVAWHARPLIVLGVLAVIVGVTRGKIDHERKTDTELSRLSTTVRLLGCVPLLVIFLGLLSATVDSFLLPGASIWSDWELALITLLTGLVLVFLVGFSLRLILPPRVRGKGLPVRVLQGRRKLVGVVAFLALVTFLAGMRHEAESLRWAPLPGAISVISVFVLAACAGWAAFAQELGVPGGRDKRWADNNSVELFAGAGASLGAGIAVYVAPVSGSRALGVAGITMLAFCGGLFALHWAAWLAARCGPRDCLPRWFPSRVPVITILVVWVLIADVKGPVTLHQARTLSSVAQSPATPLSGLVDAWLDRQQKRYPGQMATMFLPAAAGGGSKVAFWTDLVLDCVMSQNPVSQTRDQCSTATSSVRPHRLGEFFLGSGVSGGSVGLYQYLRHLRDVQYGKEWVNGAAGQDDLSPIVGWGLFHDTIAYMLGIAGTDPSKCTGEYSCRFEADRAVAQEAAEAGGWHDFTPPKNEPLDTVPYGSSRAVHGLYVPFMIFNGSIDGGVGRFLMSGANLAPPYDVTGACVDRRPGVPGALDAADVLGGGQQLPLVTAALLSARFPVVAPAGRVGSVTSLQTSGCRASELKAPLPAVRVRDGGYMENSGLLTIVDLLPRIQAAIKTWHPRPGTGKRITVRIVVVSIEDDSAVLRPHPKLTQQTSGANLSIAARSGPDYLTRIAHDELSGCQFANVTYVRISPPPNVGAQAATGWQLSETARRRNLEAALKKYPGKQTLQQIRNLLDGHGRARCQSK